MLITDIVNKPVDIQSNLVQQLDNRGMNVLIWCRQHTFAVQRLQTKYGTGKQKLDQSFNNIHVKHNSFVMLFCLALAMEKRQT